MRLFHPRRVVAAACASLVLIAGCSTAKKGASPTTGAPTTEAPAGATTTTKAAKTPSGVTLVAKPPKGVKPENWGDQTQLAVTKAGAPVLVFTHEDANGDGNDDDGQLLLTTLDTKSGKWSTPTTVAKGYFASNQATSFSLTADPDSGVLGVAVLHQNDDGDGTGVDLYWSSDDGATWSQTSVAAGLESAQLPRLAIGGGSVAVAYDVDDGVHLATATFSGTKAPGSFHDAKAPGFGDQQPDSNDFGPAVSLDAKGKPVVAYYVPDTDGEGIDLVAWDGTSDLPNKLLESKAGQEHAYTAIARHGDAVVIASSLTNSTDDDAAALLTVTSTDGGSSWKEAVAVPNDDGGDPFDVSMALASATTAIATYIPNSSGGGQKCAYPEAPWSANLASWNRCAVPADAAHPSGGTNFYPSVTASSDGTIWLAYSVKDPTEEVPAGLFVQKLTLDDLRSRGPSAGDTGNPLKS